MTDYAFDREQSARLEQTYLTPDGAINLYTVASWAFCF